VLLNKISEIVYQPPSIIKKWIWFKNKMINNYIVSPLKHLTASVVSLQHCDGFVYKMFKPFTGTKKWMNCSDIWIALLYCDASIDIWCLQYDRVSVLGIDYFISNFWVGSVIRDDVTAGSIVHLVFDQAHWLLLSVLFLFARC
jgi:hypothetical protein